VWLQPGAGVLLIEADDEWRELLAGALTASGHAVHQVSCSSDGIELAGALLPDVILLGRTADPTDPVEVCWRLRTAAQASILVIRRGVGWGDCLVLELGPAHGEVELLSFSQIVSRARQAGRPAGGGGASRPPARETLGSLSLDRDSRRVHVRGTELKLTAKEFDLLSFLVANRGRVYSAEALLAHVWRRRTSAQNMKTVAVHVRWLRTKLAGQTDAAIVTVRGAGYRLESRVETAADLG
jgi:DNA-binding response OmpR family regulator